MRTLSNDTSIVSFLCMMRKKKTETICLSNLRKPTSKEVCFRILRILILTKKLSLKSHQQLNSPVNIKILLICRRPAMSGKSWLLDLNMSIAFRISKTRRKCGSSIRKPENN
jgi:hypothetical protein